MVDPFAMALDAIFGSGMATVASYTSALTGVPVDIRIIRSQGTEQGGYEGSDFLLDVNEIQFRRSDVAEPLQGDHVAISGNDYLVQGGARLDVEGVTWTCALEDA